MDPRKGKRSSKGKNRSQYTQESDRIFQEQPTSSCEFSQIEYNNPNEITDNFQNISLANTAQNSLLLPQEYISPSLTFDTNIEFNYPSQYGDDNGSCLLVANQESQSLNTFDDIPTGDHTTDNYDVDQIQPSLQLAEMPDLNRAHSLYTTIRGVGGTSETNYQHMNSATGEHSLTDGQTLYDDQQQAGPSTSTGATQKKPKTQRRKKNEDLTPEEQEEKRKARNARAKKSRDKTAAETSQLEKEIEILKEYNLKLRKSHERLIEQRTIGIQQFASRKRNTNE